MRLFRYLPKKYLDAFFRSGRLKIGTLYEYRKIETYGTVVGDKNEGLHKIELSIPGGGEFNLASNTPEADFFRKYVLSPGQRDLDKKIILHEDARIIARNTSPDLYIYCMSSEYNQAVMKQFGCDSCMEILNPEAFFRIISHRIRHHARFDGYGAVQYTSRETHYTKPHKLHPAIMKDVEFSYQKEWRAIWIPAKPPRQPLLIDVRKAIRHCRVYAP